MNEQLSALAEQAGCAYWNIAEPRNMSGCRDEMQEFAELIIRSMTKILEDQCQKDGPEKDEWDRGYVSGMWAAERYLKKHFGVDE